MVQDFVDPQYGGVIQKRQPLRKVFACGKQLMLPILLGKLGNMLLNGHVQTETGRWMTQVCVCVCAHLSSGGNELCLVVGWFKRTQVGGVTPKSAKVSFFLTTLIGSTGVTILTFWGVVSLEPSHLVGDFGEIMGPAR